MRTLGNKVDIIYRDKSSQLKRGVAVYSKKKYCYEFPVDMSEFIQNNPLPYMEDRYILEQLNEDCEDCEG